MKNLFLILGTIVSIMVQSQIYTPGGTITGSTTTNNVGIGTFDATRKLTVKGDIYGHMIFSFQDDARFNVTPSTIPNLTIPSVSMPQYGLAAPNTDLAADLWLSGFNGIRMFTSGSAIPKFYLNANGKLGIGTQNLECTNCTGYKLFVKDGIKTEKIKVEIAASNGWADYVFEEDYPLMPLNELDQFIKTNGHLPEVPTTEEAIANGIELKEMNILLLKKIEELTLYTIEQQKRIENYEKTTKEMTDLADRISVLEHIVKSLDYK